MSVQVSDVLKVLEKLAPAHLAEKWDNVGLQAGSISDQVSALIVSLDVSMEVIKEASASGCGMIISHHPLIFMPMRSVSDETATGKLVREAGRLGIAIACAHTNLDAARGGLADMAAKIIGIEKTSPLTGATSKWLKLVTFVPQKDLDAVRGALFSAGAGVIGEYGHCSYYIEGTGTFLPQAGAEPSIGEIGTEESVPELRLEMIFPEGYTGEVVAALVAAHSYEEPAYDIYPLVTRSHNAGAGRIGNLAAPASLGDFAAAVADDFGLDSARYSGKPSRLVERVAVVTGSGAGYISEAASRADVLVTGDIRYHDLILAEESGLSLVEIPHDVCEVAALKRWVPSLAKELSPSGVEVIASQADTGRWNSADAGKKASPANDTAEREKTDGGEALYHLYVDGGSRGNPGPAGIGAVLKDDSGAIVATLSEAIGDATNNVAEYRALAAGLEMAIDRGISGIKIYSDSELVVRQLTGSYKVRSEGLRPYNELVRQLLGRLSYYELTSVPREDNAHADELVNQALDKSLG